MYKVHNRGEHPKSKIPHLRKVLELVSVFRGLISLIPQSYYTDFDLDWLPWWASFCLAIVANCLGIIDMRRQGRHVDYSRQRADNQSATTTSMSAPKFTFQQFLKRFPNDDICLQYIFDKRYKKLTHCPDCAAETKFHRIKKRKVYSCQHCGFQISPTAGTIFHKSRTPLTSWLFAVLLFANSKNGVSAKELQRQVGVTYKTAWRMGHLIRSLMDEGKDIFMGGTVELDETLMGGRKRGGKRGWGADKPCVFGMVQRKTLNSDGKMIDGGKIRTVVVPNRKASTLVPIIVEHVDEDATVYTDEFGGYNKLSREVAEHDKVQHSKYEWVRGDVHTQTIEGAWSIRKRSIRGTYTSVSPKYLQAYLNEFDFRYNHRMGCMFEEIIKKI